jgi:hypothetical protein
MLQRRTSDNASRQEGSGGDRRGSPRYEAGKTLVVLSWNEGEAYRTVVGTLRDISLGGGAALAETAPPVGTVVWFRLKEDQSSPWVAASIVAVSKTGMLGLGQRLVRWKFPEPCLYHVFKAAINGFSESVDIEEVTMPGYDKRDWRG